MAPKLVAPDFTSQELVPDSMAPKFVAPDSKCLELVLDSVPDSMAPKLVAPDSECLELVPDSLPNSPEVVPDSEVMPDSELLPPGAFVCARHDLVHEDRQDARQAKNAKKTTATTPNQRQHDPLHARATSTITCKPMRPCKKKNNNMQAHAAMQKKPNGKKAPAKGFEPPTPTGHCIGIGCTSQPTEMSVLIFKRSSTYLLG
jgi:hypothetical protein